MLKKISDYTVNRTNPCWRYDLMVAPSKHGFGGYLSKPKDYSAGQRRLWRLTDVSFETGDLFFSSELEELKDKLPEDLQQTFKTLLETSRKREAKKVKAKTEKNRVPLWNMKKVEGLNDSFLLKMIRHLNGLTHDDSIERALQLKFNEHKSELLRFIGYSIYAGKTDREIAVSWKIAPKVITALRLMFFDFSKFPKDRIANLACLRQLVTSGYISEGDFSIYKRIFELGELGLKAQVDFYQLSKAEKKEVQAFLSDSYTTQLLNMSIAIHSRADAQAFMGALAGLGAAEIKQEEINYLREKTKNVAAATKKIETDSANADDSVSDLDRELMDFLRQESLKDNEFNFKTIADLN